MLPGKKAITGISTLDTEQTALLASLGIKKPTSSNRGSQYASQAFQDKLIEYDMKCSMSRKGNCWDNAVAESFFNNLKNERVHERRYATHDEARTDVFDYIETFYNRSRRHCALLGKTPASAFEAWILKQQGKMAA